jgi:hypothetical protein
VVGTMLEEQGMAGGGAEGAGTAALNDKKSGEVFDDTVRVSGV